MSRSQTPPIVVFTEEDISDGVSLCSRSLVGRIITEKPVHVNSLQNALASIWCNPKGFKVEELEPKTFRFFFEEDADMERILRGSPWIFRNSWLSLLRWERNQDFNTLKFTTVPLRVQILGLPFHCRTPRMGHRIGSCLGEVKDSEIFEVREKGSFIKILVEFDSTKPLLPGIQIGSQTDRLMWVYFQYERLPQFCYSCGIVGHEEDTCGSSPSAGEKEDSEESNLGPWLRASQVGRRIGDTHKGHAASHGNNRQKKKTPCLRNSWRSYHL
ncbi:Zinc knuckle CX2CX4HX4C [Sesbania bispinosa]|nr:Zinc knuckle CX2CX4HX4C [Sesbania bispinosa]